MVILDHYGMIFDAVGVFGLAFHLLFKSCSSYCLWLLNPIPTSYGLNQPIRGRNRVKRRGERGFCSIILTIGEEVTHPQV